MYGIMPKAKTEAFANAPPVKALSKPKIPCSVFSAMRPNFVESIPGRTT